MPKDPVAPADATKTPADGDDTPKTKETITPKVENKTPIYETLEKEQLVELLLKKEKVAEDKYNLALKTEEEKKELASRLVAYEQKDREAELKKLEEKGEYEKITQQVLSEKKEIEDKLLESQLKANILEEENTSLNNLLVSEALNSIPEEKRDFALELTIAYKGKEKIERLKKIAEQFGNKPTSIGNAPKGSKPDDEIETIRAKFKKNPKSLTQPETKKLVEYINSKK